MLAEYNDSSLITLYTRGEELISQERNGEKSYYLYDGFDSVRMLADEDNNITDTYTFDAFGNLVSSTGDTENSYLYRGEQYDSFTGLYYLRARYMNPSTGTFITMDEYAGSVFEPVSLHKYLYANANPVTYCDPTGYSSAQTLQSQTTTIAGLAVLSQMVTPSCVVGLAILSFFRTQICNAIVIAADAIAEWCAGLASGVLTSAGVVDDIKSRAKDKAIDISDSIPRKRRGDSKEIWLAKRNFNSGPNLLFVAEITYEQAIIILTSDTLDGVYTEKEGLAKRLAEDAAQLRGEPAAQKEHSLKPNETAHYHPGVHEKGVKKNLPHSWYGTIRSNK